MTKILHSEAEARQKLLNGVNAVTDHVKKTLGPKGRNIFIEQKFNAPKSTKDGVSVARSIMLEDPAENMGAQLAIQAAEKTVDQAGDGTTATCVLLQAMVQKANKLIVAGANPIDVKRGMEFAANEIVKKLTEMKIPVSLDDTDCEVIKVGEEEISVPKRLISVATIACNGDEELGKLVARALKAVGAEGITTIEESNGIETEVDVIKGMQFDRGYVSPYFMNNERMECVLEQPYILLYDKNVSILKEALPILEKLGEKGKPILIIAEDVDGPVLGTLVVNRVKRGMPVCAVKAPAFGSRKADNLGDIAALTGGIVISQETGGKLETASLSMLGTCEKVIITENTTTIIGGAGTKEAIEKRQNEIRARIEKNESSYDVEKQQERLARLSAGVAIVRVGGKTEVERKEILDRTEDALMAGKSAVQEGIVPGGGMALLKASDTRIWNILPGLSGDYYSGIKIVTDACKEPFGQIVRNAGKEPAEIIAEVKDTQEKSEGLGFNGVQGYNAADGSYCDMVSCGIIDPLKVIRCSLENAVSVAGQILLCEGTVHEKREPLQVMNSNPDEI